MQIQCSEGESASAQSCLESGSGDKAIGTAMLISRSSAECHLYIELHACECGEARAPWKHQLESRVDALVTVYDGVCERCTRPWTFEFALDPEAAPIGKFGGARPSQIVDAGQFLAVADAAARAVPHEENHLDELSRQRARALMLRAVAAIEEVLKLIPQGADRVAADSLFSTLGKQMYLAELGRFRKSRLEAVLEIYRRAVARLS
jgi:hypothetical protein